MQEKKKKTFHIKRAMIVIIFWITFYDLITKSNNSLISNSFTDVSINIKYQTKHKSIWVGMKLHNWMSILIVNIQMATKKKNTSR